MFDRKLVYSSKDRHDWERAKALLREEGIAFKEWIAEEPPVGGCGSKIDIRSFGTGKAVPKEVFRIEVGKKDGSRAQACLKDRVQPVRYYGTL